MYLTGLAEPTGYGIIRSLILAATYCHSYTNRCRTLTGGQLIHGYYLALNFIFDSFIMINRMKTLMALTAVVYLSACGVTSAPADPRPLQWVQSVKADANLHRVNHRLYHRRLPEPKQRTILAKTIRFNYNPPLSQARSSVG